MILTIHNESPFQILSSSFSIGPSETGYELQVGADSKTFSTLFSVGANTPRMVTNVANGSYFRLKNNVGNVKVNWMKVCVTEGGGEGGSGTELEPITEFPADVPEGTVVAYAGSASATGIYQYVDNEWVAAGGDDLSDYWTSAQTKDYVDEVIEDKELPIAAAVNDLKSNIEARLDQQFYKKKEVNDIASRKVEAGQVAEQIKEYVDPAIAEVNETIEDKELPVSAALNDLNQKISEISGGSGGDMSAYWTSAQTEEAISAATSGKANAVSVSANNNFRLFPKWNNQGVITGYVGTGSVNQGSFSVNGNNFGYLNPTSTFFPTVYAPLSAGTAGDILVSTGNGAPVWSAVTIPDMSAFYTSAQTDEKIASAVTPVSEHLFDVEQVTASALTELHDGLLEVSGDVQTISAATAGKADSANVTARDSTRNDAYFPKWNGEGIITGDTGDRIEAQLISINGRQSRLVRIYTGSGSFGNIYAPTTPGTAGDVLVSTGSGAPVWTTDDKVSSTSVSTIWKGTQAEYDAITTKDPNTFYIIVNN